MVIVSWLNAHKSAGHEKGQHLVDYHRIFEHTKTPHKIGAKTTEWWSEGGLHAGVSGHHQASSNRIRLALQSHHWRQNRDI